MHLSYSLDATGAAEHLDVVVGAAHTTTAAETQDAADAGINIVGAIHATATSEERWRGPPAHKTSNGIVGSVLCAREPGKIVTPLP